MSFGGHDTLFIRFDSVSAIPFRSLPERSSAEYTDYDLADSTIVGR
jgi:hypothetical protein